ncbi:MAG: phosphatase PAP2 family protein, partial [Actinomycetes bacterium]
TGRYGDAVESGAVQVTAPSPTPRAVSVGRPPWWLFLTAALVGSVVTVELLAGGALERIDLRVAEVVGRWDLEHSVAYPAVWLATQLGGRATLLAVLAATVGHLAWRRHTWVPLVRVLVALSLLTASVYALKYGTGRTAPAFPGSFFFTPGGTSFPSGHVANAVLMWGMARWLAVEYGLPVRVQHAFRLLHVLGPVGTAVAMVALNFHWVTDAVVGAAVGIVLLGVVHALDAHVLSRWVRARAGRPSA